MTSKKYSEKEMVLSFCKLLEARNFAFAVEVPFFNRSIDLVYADRNGVLSAVEFKLHDWRKAIKQAKDCSLGAQNVYICLPSKKFNKNIEQELEGTNIGLILFDPESDEICIAKASVNKNYWEGTASTLMSGFRYSIDNCNYQHLLLA